MKPWSCRLKPESNSSLYVLVNVWPTHKDFLEFVNRTLSKTNEFEEACLGTCSRINEWKADSKGNIYKTRCFAEVNMYLDKLTMQVVTHELFHATIAWANRVKFPLSSLFTDVGVTAEEERISHVHSNMCSDFVLKASVKGAPYDKLHITQQKNGRRTQVNSK